MFFNNNPCYTKDGERALETIPDFFKNQIKYKESSVKVLNIGNETTIHSSCSQYQGVFFNNNLRYAKDEERNLQTLPDFLRKYTSAHFCFYLPFSPPKET